MSSRATISCPGGLHMGKMLNVKARLVDSKRCRWMVLLICSLVLLAEAVTWSTWSRQRHMQNTPLNHVARYHLPMLYPQVPNVHAREHNTTWYVISAFMDTRPLLYDHAPSIALVAAGPVEEVKRGKHWHARIFTVISGGLVATLSCETTQYDPIDQHTSQHAAATVFCPTEHAWEELKLISEDLGVCLVSSADSFCEFESVVPIGIPPQYPMHPLSKSSGYRHDENAIVQSVAHQGKTRHYTGKGKIAVCVPMIRGDLYVESFTFFLRYYKKLGVDTVFLYMSRPGNKMSQAAAKITLDQSRRGNSKKGHDTWPRLIVLPWCMQLGDSYGCRRGQPRILSAEFFDFAGSNHGQLLLHQDCLFRTIGEFRWTLFVDLDEFVQLNVPKMLNLHDLIAFEIQKNQGVAPTELSFRSAFFENCLPTAGENASVNLLSKLERKDFLALPRPAWTPARVSEVFPKYSRSKFISDPITSNRAGIHFIASFYCDKYKGDVRPHLKFNCSHVLVPDDIAILHHARVIPRTALDSPYTACSAVPGVVEIDWNLTNFLAKIGLLSPLGRI
jgi:Glycosyltransferase family 92